MKRPKSSLPAGNVLVTSIAIGALSLVLAAGLQALRVIDRLDHWVGQSLSPANHGAFPKSLPPGSLWVCSVVFGFGLAVAILSIPGHGRRLLVWVTALFLIGGWGPVLVLAAHAPDISLPWIVVWWSGICAMVYAASHRMGIDSNAKPPVTPHHETR